MHGKKTLKYRIKLGHPAPPKCELCTGYSGPNPQMSSLNCQKITTRHQAGTCRRPCPTKAVRGRFNMTPQKKKHDKIKIQLVRVQGRFDVTSRKVPFSIHLQHHPPLLGENAPLGGKGDVWTKKGNIGDFLKDCRIIGLSLRSAFSGKSCVNGKKCVLELLLGSHRPNLKTCGWFFQRNQKHETEPARVLQKMTRKMTWESFLLLGWSGRNS